jgi:hypothetical protein
VSPKNSPNRIAAVTNMPAVSAMISRDERAGPCERSPLERRREIRVFMWGSIRALVCPPSLAVCQGCRRFRFAA